MRIFMKHYADGMADAGGSAEAGGSEPAATLDQPKSTAGSRPSLFEIVCDEEAIANG
jgi:hypothetical protein